MALFAYQQQTQRLIRDIQQKDVNPTDLVSYINEARSQLAGESQSIKVLGTIPTIIANTGPYAFSSISLAGSSGVAGVLNVRMLRYAATGGQITMTSRPWPWFQQYNLYDPALTSGAPTTWAQYADGVNGTFYVSPRPDQIYTLDADTICYPVNLVNDQTVEAIPPEWTTAIPYYAAYLALLSFQSVDRAAEAEKMYQLYQLFVQRGRQIATPDVLPRNYPQSPPPADRAGGGGGA